VSAEKKGNVLTVYKSTELKCTAGATSFQHAILVSILTVAVYAQKLIQIGGFTTNTRDRLTCYNECEADSEWIQGGCQKEMERQRKKGCKA